jgi:gliding motility-associated-like protein
LNEYTASNSETVSLRVTDEYGCIGNGAAEILVHAPVLDLGEDKQVCDPAGEELYVDGYANYQWSTGDIASSLTVFSGDGPISLTVTDWNNCSATDEITILPCDITSVIEIPRIISPNGDGIDDTWIIPDIDQYPDAHIQVFDMYGRRIFMVNGDYSNTWDGTYGGRQLPVGRYFYIIDFKSSDLQPLHGAVTIIR